MVDGPVEIVGQCVSGLVDRSVGGLVVWWVTGFVGQRAGGPVGYPLSVSESVDWSASGLVDCHWMGRQAGVGGAACLIGR